MTTWISTKAWCPEDCIDVLITYARKGSNDLHIGLGYYLYGDSSWNLSEPLEDDYFSNEDSEQIKVLYWTLLPDLPKIDKNWEQELTSLQKIASYWEEKEKQLKKSS